MIKTFSVTNFKTFERKTTLDFSKTGNYEFNENAIKNNIVNTAILFGPNACGKTSISLAIFDIVTSLTDNFVCNCYNNYVNANSGIDCAEFEYLFSFEGKEVLYKYKKRNVRDLIAESLCICGKEVISYDKTISSALNIDFKGAENLNRNIDLLKISALKYVFSNTVLEENEYTKLFNDLFSFVNKMLLFWNLQNRSFVGFTAKSDGRILDEILERNHFEDLVEFFRAAGFNEKLVHNAKSGNELLYIEYENGKQIEFGEVASTGMNSLLLLYFWLEDLSNAEIAPSFVCIDEFDAFYHYELSQFVVKKLRDSNCQIFLTSHNTALMTNYILRPDCYYIFKDGEVKNMNNRTQKEIRQGNNLEKLYRGKMFDL